MSIKPISFKIHQLFSSKKLMDELNDTYKVDRNYDIPYIAGYSKDNKTIFIDRHFKKMMGSIDVEPYVFVHEKIEKALIDNFGFKYQQAHKLATFFEKKTVEKAGLNWGKYNKFVMDQYKKIGHESIQKVPKNLDLTPYEDEKDYKILRGMVENGIKLGNKKG